MYKMTFPVIENKLEVSLKVSLPSRLPIVRGNSGTNYTFCCGTYTGSWQVHYNQGERAILQQKKGGSYATQQV